MILREQQGYGVVLSEENSTNAQLTWSCTGLLQQESCLTPNPATLSLSSSLDTFSFKSKPSSIICVNEWARVATSTLAAPPFITDGCLLASYAANFWLQHSKPTSLQYFHRNYFVSLQSCMQTPNWVGAESYSSEPPTRERYYTIADRPHTPVTDDINGGNSGSFPVKRSYNWLTIREYLPASTTLTECLVAVIRPLISLMEDPRMDQLWSQAWLQRNSLHGLTDIDTMTRGPIGCN